MHVTYHTRFSLRIDWADLDLFGHVNNVAFFKYIQAARVNYCELAGLTTLNEAGKPGFVVASSQCRFKHTLHYPGVATIEARLDWMKNTSLQLAYRLLDQDGQLCAEAEDVLVVYDYALKAKLSISPALRAAIQKIEQRGI